ncbi:heme-transporting ATPase [Aureococcus anophagefferens]|nr:heme-transporting ATPase [Aureococcus anophagefferens]
MERRRRLLLALVAVANAIEAPRSVAGAAQLRGARDVPGATTESETDYAAAAETDGAAAGPARAAAPPAPRATLGEVFAHTRGFVAATPSQQLLFALTFAFLRCQRAFGAAVFGKAHAMDARWHANHPTGEVAVAFGRGTRGVASLLFLGVFSVVPTVLELVFSVGVLRRRFGSHGFGLVTLATFAAYAAWTASLVELRLGRRRALVALENKKGAYLVDSLANHESVAANVNEALEQDRFDEVLAASEREAVASQALGGALNLGQAAIFAVGLHYALRLALRRFDAAASFSIGDVVAVNALLLQLAQPMNFLGYTVSEIRQGLVDADAVVKLLRDAPAAADDAPPHAVPSPPEIAFSGVSASRDGFTLALKNATFTAPAGGVTLLVGASGSGKSTALRLVNGLDAAPTAGAVTVGGLALSAADARRATALVAQDTALFDDTVLYNAKYGNVLAPLDAAVAALAAAGAAHLDPRQRVGERRRPTTGACFLLWTHPFS